MAVQGDETRLKILEYIIDFKMSNDGISPTYREMVEGVGISMTNLHKHIHVLVEQSMITLVGGKNASRAINVGGNWGLRKSLMDRMDEYAARCRPESTGDGERA